AVLELDRARALARLEDDGMAAHLEHADLERRARAERRVEEHERDALALQVGRALRLARRLELGGVREDRFELGARPVQSRQKVARRFGHFGMLQIAVTPRESSSKLLR